MSDKKLSGNWEKVIEVKLGDITSEACKPLKFDAAEAVKSIKFPAYKGTGKKTKFTPEVVEKLLESIADGNYYETAYNCAGIGKDSFFRFLKHNADFSDLVKKAESFAQRKYLKVIENASEKTWTAAAWILERRFQEKFCVKNKIDIPGLESVTIKISQPRKSKELEVKNPKN